MLGYEQTCGGLYLPVQGPIDQRPKKINVKIHKGKVNPDGAILMFSGTIGARREVAEKIYRDHGYEPIFVETP